MTEPDRPGVTLDRPAKRKPNSSRLADLGDRIARTFTPTVDRAKTPEGPWDVATEAHYAVTDGTEAAWEDEASPFPIAREGYDRDAVDSYLNELEQEIDELRAHTSSDNTVSAEIKRIGEQAAAILQTAHQQATETTRKARKEAEKCLADAAANAIAMNDEAKAKLRTVDSETDAVWRERARLIEDVRNVATALFSLAEDAADRFPSEDDKRAATASARGKPAVVPASAAARAQPTAAPAAPAAATPRPAAATPRPSPETARAPVAAVRPPAAPVRPPVATGAPVTTPRPPAGTTRPTPVAARPPAAMARPPAATSAARGDHAEGADNGGDGGPVRES